MKKMILLLILPLTVLMAIDFTMTQEGLFTKTTTPVTVPGETSSYLEPINLPECDASNPEVQFIRSNADWSKINSSSKRIFCVSPGNYSSLGNIKLTVSGTDGKRRYIVLNNGNDLHPGKLNKSQLANFALDLQAVNYWVVDRAASFDVNIRHSFIIGKNSTHNIFNRLFTQNLYHTMWVRDKAHYNTIQNGRFDGVTDAGAAADLSTVNIAEGGDSVKLFEVFGTKIINNEFVNVKAGRCNRFPAEHLASGISQISHFDGTIFDSNTIETTKSIRTDCKGNFTPNGECIALEAGAISFKGGSKDANKPIIVSNNHAWGMRQSDPTYERLSSPGGFSMAYMGAENIIIDNNVIFDTTKAISFADRYEMPYGSKNIVIKNNLIVDSGKNRKIPMVMNFGVDNVVKDNILIRTDGAWAEIWGRNTNLYCGNNIIIDPGSTDVLKTSSKPNGFDTNKIFDTAVEAGYTDDYTFTTDKFTNNPRIITLKNVLKAN